MKYSPLFVFLLACSSSKSATTPVPTVPTPQKQSIDLPSQSDSWNDWKNFTNVSPGPWVSNTHGKRFVEIYVNDIALDAYKTPGAAMPVGSIVVKPSWENDNGEKGVDGPLFVMEKMPTGFAPESDDWFFAFQWPTPPEKFAKKIGTNVDWRSPSEKIEYCSDCHDALDRGLGMPPKERRADW